VRIEGQFSHSIAVEAWGEGGGGHEKTDRAIDGGLLHTAEGVCGGGDRKFEPAVALAVLQDAVCVICRSFLAAFPDDLPPKQNSAWSAPSATSDHGFKVTQH